MPDTVHTAMPLTAVVRWHYRPKPQSEQPKADVLLRPREPLVIERYVPPIFVHFEQRLVDPLTQGAAIGDGNTVLLRREDWTNDPQDAVAQLRGQVLKRRRVEDHSLDITVRDEIAPFLD